MNYGITITFARWRAKLCQNFSLLVCKSRSKNFPLLTLTSQDLFAHSCKAWSRCRVSLFGIHSLQTLRQVFNCVKDYRGACLWTFAVMCCQLVMTFRLKLTLSWLWTDWHILRFTMWNKNIQSGEVDNILLLFCCANSCRYPHAKIAWFDSYCENKIHAFLPTVYTVYI